MSKAFILVSDAVHITASQYTSTQLFITKEWVGRFARMSFSPSEWAALTEKLQQEGYIHEEEPKAA